MGSLFLRSKWLVLLGLASVTFAVSSQMWPQHYSVTISRKQFQEHLKELRQGEFDVAGTNLKNGTVTLIVDRSGLSTLNSMGLTDSFSVMDLRGTRPDPKFKTPDQIESILRNYASTYPELATVQSIGKSLEGRETYMLRITKRGGSDESKRPGLLLNAMHHAREVMSPEVPLDAAEYLLTNYGKDQKVTQWVDSNIIYVLPMLNVDGNNRVWSGDSMWRKNVREGFGVDINRNYPYSWNNCDGSSSYKGAQDYHGPSAASEPETNNMMGLIAATRPMFSISFHSFSEVLIYPYGCGQHTETKEIVEPLGNQMASLIKSDDGSGSYTAGIAPDLLYAVDGDDISWMYHEYRVIPYVIELNSDQQGFQPSYDRWRDSTVQRVRPAWQLLLDRMSGPALVGDVGKPAKLIVKRTDGNFTDTFPTRPDGSFHVLVNPGTYTVKVESEDGTVKVQRQVIVGTAPQQVSLPSAF